MRILRKISMCVPMVVALVVTTACGSQGAGTGSGGSDPFHVVALGAVSLSGPLGANARTSIMAIKASAKVMNKQGGILGHHVKVTVIDAKAKPTRAVTELQRVLRGDEEVDLVVNSGPSNITAATLPLLERAGVLSFSVGPTKNSGNPEKFPLNFDLSPSPAAYAASVAAYFEKKGYDTAGIIHGNSAYGKAFGKAVEEALTEAGIEVVGNQQYDTSALDMTAQVAALKAADPDAVVVDAYGPPAGYLLKSFQKVGWDVPLVGNTSVAASSVVSTPPPKGLMGTAATENLVFQVFDSTVYQEPHDPQVRQMVEAMSALGEIPTTLILAYNYDALPLVAAAAEKAGSLEAEALAKALENPRVQKAAETAVLEQYNYSANSHSPNVSPEAFRFIEPAPLEQGQFHPKGA